MRRTLTLCALLLAWPGLPARAETTDRASVTLGALADRCDRVVLARVTALEQDQVELEVLDVLKGRATPLPGLARGALSWRLQELALLFLDEGPDGATGPPRTAWHKLSVPDEVARDHLLEVVRGRLPALGGDPAALRAALFAQLGSSIARVREDAGLDLLGWSRLEPTPAERAALRRALATEARPELLALAARLPESALLEPLLAIGRAAPQVRTRTLAAEALRAVDEAAALGALGPELQDGARTGAAAAARLIGAIGGPAAERLLAGALADPRPEVKKAALAGLGDAAARGLSDSAPLVAVARGPEREAARRALATLARAADGAALSRLEATLADPELRELAGRLRADPLLARELLAE